jgi:hypothetical protein
MYINVDIDDKLYKGDTIIIPCIVNEIIDEWEIRAEIYDLTGNSIKIATENVTGGSDDQISIEHVSGSDESTFTLTFAEDLTTNFDNDVWLEIERIDSLGHKKTIFQTKLFLTKEQITWDDVE